MVKTEKGKYKYNKYQMPRAAKAPAIPGAIGIPPFLNLLIAVHGTVVHYLSYDNCGYSYRHNVKSQKLRGDDVVVASPQSFVT